jgi:molybdate transport system substrate-binding protein
LVPEQPDAGGVRGELNAQDGTGCSSRNVVSSSAIGYDTILRPHQGSTMKHAWKTEVFALLLALTAGLGSLCASEITVFAAASLTDAMKSVASAYERQTGDRILFNFAASSTLARQIEEGAPADIFFSADEACMDALQKNGRIVPETRKSRLSNSLVIVVAVESQLAIRSARDLTGAKIRRVALADPARVPAGVYARLYLQRLKLWHEVEPKVVPTENVRAALAAVESGNVEAGVVYKTDSAISRKVRVAFEVPREDTPDISYPLAMVSETEQPDAAGRFLQYLESETAARVFEAFGFVVRR